MREFFVSQKHDKKRVDAFLFDVLSGISSSVIFKAFRKRSIKVNSKRVKESYILESGDHVEVYIPDEYLKASLSSDAIPLPSIVYEDDFITIVSKPQGVPVHQDKNNESLVLDQWLIQQVKKTGIRSFEKGFPSLCHRIDRNTGGLVIFANDSKTLSILEDKFRSREIEKKYLCIVYGIPEKKTCELTSFLKKDSAESRVFIYDNPVKDSEKIVTQYSIIAALKEYALLEVKLVTGKTHQIRAHLSYIGHPILGDGKYGINSVNKALKLKWQALWAYKLNFAFTSPSSHLSYLNGKEIALPHIQWEGYLSNLMLKENGHNIIV